MVYLHNINRCTGIALTHHLSKEKHKNYKKLLKKLRALKPNKRICNLAIPKYLRRKYESQAIQRFEKEIEIVKSSKISTRLEQLALEQVRKVVCTRNEFKPILDASRDRRLKQLIRKSMYSFYSRLSNARPPEKRTKFEKWTAEDWERHNKWLSFRAKPKQIPTSPTITRNTKPLSEMIRMEILAQPRTKFLQHERKWELTETLQNYKPTERILELSTPRPRIDNTKHKQIGYVPQTALKYKITEHLEKLAMHREKRVAATDKKENPYDVSINALKAQPSSRIQELALPRISFVLETKIDPYKVSKNALKANPSKRITELSVPRKYYNKSRRFSKK